MEILPALIPRSVDDVSATVEIFSQTTVTLHIDVVDGVYVGKDASWNFLEPLPAYGGGYEVHLMVAEPEEWVERVCVPGVRRVIVQYEGVGDPGRVVSVLKEIRARGMEVGVSILLDTPETVLEVCVGLVDVIQVMSIPRIGEQGVPFDLRAYERVRTLAHTYASLPIAVDGGVTLEKVAPLSALGARRLVVGSAILHTQDPLETYRMFTESLHHDH